MAITTQGLVAGFKALRVGSGGSNSLAEGGIELRNTPTGAALGSQLMDHFGFTSLTTDEIGSTQLYDARGYFPSDVVINITTSGTVNYIVRRVQDSGTNWPMTHGDFGPMWEIQLDTPLSVINGGYVTIKGGDYNTYLSLESSMT